MADLFITAFAGEIISDDMESALALVDVGLESFSDQIDTGTEIIDIMGVDMIAGFGKLGIDGATLCAAPTDAAQLTGAEPLIY